jgi:hypothetical protein
VGAEDQAAEEYAGLSEEAQADAAPAVTRAAYTTRQAWKPGRCIGFIINSERPVAFLKWPKWKTKE